MAYGTIPGADDQDPLFLTTREVADLLRVKERKVYDLAAAGEIPHRRITGKLLFPRAELLAWIDGDGEPVPAERPAVLAGSHDPLLDWAVRESGAPLATLLNGSTDGLDRYTQGEAAMTGLHIPEASGWNIRTVSNRGLRDCVLIGWAVRTRGLILGAGAQHVESFADLKGLRVATRQAGAGASALFDVLMVENGLQSSDLNPASSPSYTESDAAAAVAAGQADAALGIGAMAQQFNLTFRPLMNERFDLLIDRRAYFTAPVQKVMRFTLSDAFRDKAAALGGYDLSETGLVRWVSP